MSNRFFTLILCIAIGIFTLPQMVLGFSIDNIRIGKYNNNTRFVVEMSDDTQFRAFSLESPERIVIDLPLGSVNASNNRPDPTNLIKQYRFGTFKQNTTRMVLDLSKPSCIQSAFILPKKMSGTTRLVIDMTPCSTVQFKQSLNQVHGTSSTPTTQRPIKTAQTNIAPKDVITIDQDAQKKEKLTIVVDPGHGGNDPGAIAKNGAYEKNITLAIAKKLKEALQNKNYTVYLTREDDRFIKLRDRTKFARKKGADLFVSLHADSIRKRNVQGASIYTLSDKASDKESAMLAERENKADTLADIDLSHEEEDVADILIDLAMRDTMNQSKTMADFLEKSLRQHRVNMLERPLRSAGFAVLKAPDLPAILIEMGYLSSDREAKLLNQQEYQYNIANAIAEGIDQYLAKRELQDTF